jgi:nucleotide-binding universal stress UspA family protein
MFENYLFPLDGSEIAEKAIPLVMNIPQTCESSEILLGVLPPFRKSLTPSIKIIDMGKAWMN